ncbi:hypothetical protein NC651_037784 [Populus alba x Populus x berolinensis]|nr:hypothetical protein NC651_037784 [Populus alba x Populus x berolinensis]
MSEASLPRFIDARNLDPKGGSLPDHKRRAHNSPSHQCNHLETSETAIGVGTVGSSEAINVGWFSNQEKVAEPRSKAEGNPYDKPNSVTGGAIVQVCWEKFARYFEVELKEVKHTDGYYVMDPEKCSENGGLRNTICVAAILGSTLHGEYGILRIHGRCGPSGGFIATFIYPEL